MRKMCSGRRRGNDICDKGGRALSCERVLPRVEKNSIYDSKGSGGRL